MNHRCERVQAQIPRLVDGSLPAWRRRLFERHVRRCEDCGEELERQLAVNEGLRSMGAAADEARPEPPDDLLEAILSDVNDPGLRARAAVPVRGAVSGARPALSVAGLLLTAAVVYLLYRAARALLDLVDDEA